MRVLFLLGLLVAGLPLTAGTLIYKTADGQEKIVSQVTIMTIANQMLTLKIDSGTETIPLRSLVKYYDTDIRGGGEFEDNTAAYDIILGTEKCPTDGYQGSSDKRKTAEFTIGYSVRRKEGEAQKNELRVPYLYLFVLTSGDGGDRNFYSFSYPDKARVSMKAYDEAKMLEKVIALNRPTYYPDDRGRLGRPSPRNAGIGGDRIATFKLDGIRKQRIIAWYLVAWGKNRIEAEKSWQDHSYRIARNWWIR